MNSPAVRLLRHPGPIGSARWMSVPSATSRAFRFALTPGRTLHDCVVEALCERGIRSAALNLFGGGFGSLSYCLTVPRQGANQVASYTEPVTVSSPVALVMANATLGEEADGEPLVHCHALFTDESRRLRGGHLFPTDTIAGAKPPVAFARSLDNIAVRRRFDPETNFFLLQPEMTGGADG